jgi:hypothetical protein
MPTFTPIFSPVRLCRKVNLVPTGCPLHNANGTLFPSHEMYTHKSVAVAHASPGFPIHFAKMRSSNRGSSKKKPRRFNGQVTIAREFPLSSAPRGCTLHSHDHLTLSTYVSRGFYQILQPSTLSRGYNILTKFIRDSLKCCRIARLSFCVYIMDARFFLYFLIFVFKEGRKRGVVFFVSAFFSARDCLIRIIPPATPCVSVKAGVSTAKEEY